MYLSIFLSTSKQPTGASAGKRPRRLLQAFFQPRRAGESRASGSSEPHCPLQTTESKMPASAEENRSFLLGFRQRTGQRSGETYGGCPWGPEKEREPLEGAQANHPWTARVPLDPPTEPQRGGKKSGRPGSSGVAEAWFWACPGEPWCQCQAPSLRPLGDFSPKLFGTLHWGTWSVMSGSCPTWPQQDGYFVSLPCPLLCQSTLDWSPFLTHLAVSWATSTP